MLSTQTIDGKDIHVTDEGFLADAAEWTPAIGESIATQLGITLTPEHWKVITYCREDAARQGGAAPGLRRIAQHSGVSMKDLYRLFPQGPGKLAARIAGLPKPKSCI
jgi:tRNA 2-thiouridine synthesizing protein E